MLLEQVTTVDANVRERRRQRSSAFVERNARSIADLQRRGLADPQLVPYDAARALSAMVSRTAYHTICIDELDTPVEVLAETRTRLWLNALKLDDDRPRTKE
jgi:hypothetical protein